MLNRITGLALSGLLGAAALGTAPVAQAALVCGGGVCTDTVIVGPQPTELIGGTLLFPLFDSNLGTLNGALVTVTAEARILPGSQLTNYAATPQSFKVSQDVEFGIVDSTDSGGLLDTALQSLSLVTSTGLVVFTSVASGASVPFGPRTDSATGDLTAAVGSLAPFEAPGGGTHDFIVDTLTVTSLIGGGGNIAGDFITHGFVQIDILYVYTERDTDAPEPMSLALMGVGLAGLGAANTARRRRKAQF